MKAGGLEKGVVGGWRLLEHEELTGRIIGAAIDVHRVLGPGFLESIYEHALVIELMKQDLRVERQVEIPVMYEGREVGRHILDLVVENTIVVELKTVKVFTDIHFAILKSYLRAVNLTHGLLLNFAKLKVDVKRVRQDPSLN